MSVEELLNPRYKVVHRYPGSPFEVGTILWQNKSGAFESDDHYVTSHELENYPHLFRKLSWYEDRTIDDLKSVEHVKVVKYRGYWIVGDVVPVRLKVDEQINPLGYILQTSHFQTFNEVDPATHDDYLAWKERENMRMKK